MPLFAVFNQGLLCFLRGTIKGSLYQIHWENSLVGSIQCGPGRIAQLVMCLATDASLTADPRVASLIPARSHTLVESDYEIISTVILLPSAELFKKDCCRLQAKVCAQSTFLLLVQACPGKKCG